MSKSMSNEPPDWTFEGCYGGYLKVVEGTYSKVELGGMCMSKSLC